MPLNHRKGFSLMWIPSVSRRISGSVKQLEKKVYTNKFNHYFGWEPMKDVYSTTLYFYKLPRDKIDNLAKDIKAVLPNIKGYSARNLRYVKKFTKEITDENFLQTVSAKL